MKIKTKLVLGVGFLFTLIVLLAVVGAVNILALKDDSENILVANYNSLQYTQEMLESLEDTSVMGMQRFERSLKRQLQNITELGESNATARLRDYFYLYKNDPRNIELRKKMREQIHMITHMNMQAIETKNEIAKSTADKAIFWIIITGISCFVLAFWLLIKLPSNIANPIRKLTDSIKQIAAKNYSERVRLTNEGEFRELARSFNIMAQKLEEYNNTNIAKLMLEKTRVETLINNMHDPVIGLDDHLRVIFANEEALKVTGLNHSELVGVLAQEVALNNDLVREVMRDIMLGKNTSQAGRLLPIKIFSENKEGYFEKEVFDIRMAPIGEDAMRVVGHMIILRNVTAYKELDFAKTNFIATISHEFKTPISSIKMSSQLLENHQIGALNDEQRSLVNSIQEDANRLLKITGELLNMSQIESGNIQLSAKPFDAKELVLYAIDANRLAAEAKEVRFEIDCPDSISRIIADNDKTTWVLTNLVSNAIRYSHEKSVVSLRLEETEGLIKLSVSDAGRGIEREYIDRIFERYFRVPGTNKDGTGLGLAISKEFIEAQGGHLTVESELGKGSTFTMTLPKEFNRS